ncbi:MAG: 30S ribosomal protein S3 [Clostridia bacterium]|jgi:small subunit ribosomal protein S3|nr:30S ribosomal protein S3 [Clostridia bacterium]MDD4275575.1 30S ribosomal protein S3 [Clostridia bacterium]
MGQKVNPHGLRVGIIKGWNAQWYASKKEFSVNLVEDYKIRTFIKNKYFSSAISSITIERTAARLVVNIFSARPGVLIGQKGAGIEILKQEITKLTDVKNITINVREIKRPDLDSVLLAEGIAAQIEKRVTFRRAMKQGISKAVKSGSKGVKIMISGRLDGAEIARSEHYQVGLLPLQTLRADIDYGTAEAHTTYGVVGIKVWIYKGEILAKPSETSHKKEEEVNNNVNS